MKPAVMDNTANLMQGQSSLHYRNPLSTKKKHRTQHDINRGFMGIDKVKNAAQNN
jgi:hypothetical protein